MGHVVLSDNYISSFKRISDLNERKRKERENNERSKQNGK